MSLFIVFIVGALTAVATNYGQTNDESINEIAAAGNSTYTTIAGWAFTQGNATAQTSDPIGSVQFMTTGIFSIIVSFLSLPGIFYTVGTAFFHAAAMGLGLGESTYAAMVVGVFTALVFITFLFGVFYAFRGVKI
jgi:hypothetical protein